MSPDRPDKKSDTIKFRVPWSLKRDFMQRARQEGRPASDIFRDLMEDYLRRPAQRATQTLETAMTAVRRHPRRATAGAVAILGAAVLSAVFAGALPAGAEPDLRTRFEERDSNGDGVIDEGEYGAMFLFGPGIGPAERRRTLVSQDLSRFDADGNGGLSFDEYIARAAAGWQRAFTSIDRDGDGLITAAEASLPRFITEQGPDRTPRVIGVVMQRPDLMAQMDANGDGRITPEEHHNASLAKSLAQPVARP